MKKLIALLVCFSLSAYVSGCTSKDSKEESDSPSMEESTDSVNGELEKLEGDDAQFADSDYGNDSGFLDEPLPQDALGENPSSASIDSPPPDQDMSLDQPPPVAATAPEVSPEATPEVSPDMTAPSEASIPPLDDSSAMVAGVDPGTTAESATEPMAEAPAEVMPEAPKKANNPYQKIKTAPFTEGGQLLNAVYVARPNDSFKSVAKMIYGDESRSKDLKKANPSFSSLKTGNKVYYNSPQRPTDDQKMATYYEDAGIMPETYIAKEGDNIRKVAKELLGFDKAWKEVYAFNAVESKGELMAGTELKYWKSAPPAMEAPPTMASNMNMNEPPPSMPPDFPPPPDTAMNTMPPDIPPPPPAADIPPPPPEMAMTQPPPPPEMAPPPPPPEMPPPPPVVKKSAPKDIQADGGMDNDMVMALGGGGILLIGLVAIMILRKRKQAKEMAAAFNETQVGT
jgi:hypothetical protein